MCSTVQQTNRNTFRVTYMPETLRKSTLGSLGLHDEVNLERSLTLNSLIGGHLVQGRGVQPDRRVLETRASLLAGRDLVLDEALRAAHGAK